MSDWASRDVIEAAIESWTAEQVECRAYQHNWRPLTVRHRPGFYSVTHRCARCSNMRMQDMDEQGYPATPWRMVYTSGYLLHGSGRVGRDGRAALRLATIRNLPVEEVEDE